jgi:hypothetical protein
VGTPSIPALVLRYADRFDGELGSGGTHSIGSPLGAWLLLALVAPAASGADRHELEAVLGSDAEVARRLAGELLASPHPAVAAALALWYREEFLLASFGDWTRTLPSVTETGRIPSQGEADEWARRTTDGIIEHFPIELDPLVVIAFANALATRIEWSSRFDLAPASALASPWSQQVQQVLDAPGGAHRMLIARTERAGDVAVHAASSEKCLTVVSVIADPGVAPARVRAAAHDVAALMVERPSSAVTACSLFDLPQGEGHAWTLEEREVRADRDPPREQYAAFLPAWTARGDHDLLGAGPALGFPAGCRILGEFVDTSRGRLLYEAKQVASASFHQRGFEAAAITSMAVRLSAPAPSASVVQRCATLRFGRPYAVVAVAVDADGGPWHGVPVFSAWVAEPSEPFDEPAPGE